MGTNLDIMAAVNAVYEGKVKSESEKRVGNPCDMDDIVDSFAEEVNAVASGTIYMEEKFQYALALILNSRVLEQNENFRYWSPAETLDGMPGDARVALIYKPTYFATSILLNIYDSCSDEEKQVLREPLAQAMQACCGRNFRGHGYDAEEGFVETMQIFKSFNIGEIIRKYPDICTEFTELYEDSEPVFENMLNVKA